MSDIKDNKYVNLDTADDDSREIQGALTFVLAGNPNCGKTTLFNSLTGSTAYVGNWPGVTVEKRSGIYRNKKLGNCNIVDLPGIYSLSPYSPEEIVSRNFILDGNSDCVINVIDGTNLERNLYMTTQIMEMDIPMIVAINMMDLVNKDGIKIDCEALSQFLGVPVIPISALKKENLHSMMEIAIQTAKQKRKAKSILCDTEKREQILQAENIYVESNVSHPLFHAVKALEADELEKKNYPQQYLQVQEIRQEKDFGSLFTTLRYQRIIQECQQIMLMDKKEVENKLSISDKVDRVLTNKWVGIPIFLVILFIIFELTFSEDLFFLNAAGVFGENGLHTPLGWIGSGNGISSLGVFLSNFINWITGWITIFFSDIVLKGASLWAVSMVCDGILGGIFAVLGFLPQILVMFFFFSILEDSGYMSRVAFILDRIFRRFGLSGRAFLPMIMGLGCGVPAMLNTRTLPSEKERIQTIRVIPFFSCSAKLPIITAVAGVLLTAFSIPGANFIVYGVYIFSIASALVAIIVMQGTTLHEELPPFIMEFPSYHFPQPSSLGIHVWDKAKHFFKKTFAIIALSTFFIWLFSRISWDWQYLAKEGVLFAYNEAGVLWAVIDNLENVSQETINALIQAGKMNQEMTLVDYNAAVEMGMVASNFAVAEVIPNLQNSILGSLGMLITPLFTPMGFGLSSAYTPHIIAGNNGSWAFSVSALFGLIAKENTIGSFGTLSSAFPSVVGSLNLPSNVYPVLDTELDGGIGAIKAIIENTFYVNTDGSLRYPLETTASLISFVMFNVTTIPCFASVATAKAEIYSKKAFYYTIGFWLLSSYLIGCLTYLVIVYWWSTFIVLFMMFITFLSIYIYRHKKTAKIGV